MQAYDLCLTTPRRMSPLPGLRPALRQNESILKAGPSMPDRPLLDVARLFHPQLGESV